MHRLEVGHGIIPHNIQLDAIWHGLSCSWLVKLIVSVCIVHIYHSHAHSSLVQLQPPHVWELVSLECICLCRQVQSASKLAQVRFNSRAKVRATPWHERALNSCLYNSWGGDATEM